LRIHNLELRGLRCHDELRLEVEAPLVILDGDNGAGKTTVLEAISLLCALKSFRRGRNRELIQTGRERARVAGLVSSSGLRRELLLELSAGGRRLRVDGKQPQSLSGYFRQLKCVSFSPEDLAMVRAAPELRRAFVDRACFTLDPTHLNRVRGFSKALEQRNAALRRQRKGAELAVWTEAYLDAANSVRKARRALLEELIPVLQRIHGELIGGGTPLELRWRLSGGQDLHEGLSKSNQQERERRSTQVGPQRDLFGFFLGALDLRSHGSQGQVRTAALAAKLALLELAAGRTGLQPLLLLDDVGSELDRRRAAALLSRVLAMGCQTFVTTTDRRQLPLPERNLQCVRIGQDFRGF
jgi:DNA replication and repair protein RecF